MSGLFYLQIGLVRMAQMAKAEKKMDCSSIEGKNGGERMKLKQSGVREDKMPAECRIT